jgi:thiamine-phosphate pyrophosphorylase
MVTAPRISGLYAITPELEDDALLFDRVAQALGGGARVLQYRDKNCAPERALARAVALRRVCHAHGALCIVNDSVDLCEQAQADGVHLGRHDAGLRAARSRLGEGALIGVSCYDDYELARAARDQGADYVAFGSVFASSVKPSAVRAPLSLFTRARAELDIALVAIGGINVENAPEVLAAGADALAVISALFDAPDVRSRAQSFSRMFPARSISSQS